MNENVVIDDIILSNIANRIDCEKNYTIRK